MSLRDTWEQVAPRLGVVEPLYSIIAPLWTNSTRRLSGWPS